MPANRNPRPLATMCHKFRIKLKYRILTKNKKIYFTPNNVVYSTMLICSIPVSIKYFVLKDTNYKNWDIALVAIMGLVFILGVIFSLFKIGGYKTLKGELNGKLEFNSNEIIVDKQTYKINEIKKIEISSFDFRGRFAWFKGNLDGNKSNGTENELKITLNSNETIKINFEQIYENQILTEKESLINYCNCGKMNYINLIDNLRITDYKEIQNFKKKYLSQFK